MKNKSSSRTSWQAKLERIQEPKVVEIPPSMQKRFGVGRMVIPKPLDVDGLIRRIKKGKLVTQAELRRRLAQDCRADVACPITTGIFVRIVAEAAAEALERGKKSVTPFWRVVRDDGSLIEKFPGGVQAQAKRLRSEG